MTTFAALSDSDLIERTLAGTTECFDALIERHGGAVRSCVRRMTPNAADADDLAQETFLKAWRALRSFRGESSFRTWITKVAINEALQHRRAQNRTAVEIAKPDMETYAGRESSPEEAAAQAERHAVVRRAVAGLPAKYRAVLVMCDLREMKISETAANLRAGLPLVKSRLFRARRMLRLAA